MSEEKVLQKLTNLGNALTRLAEALAEPIAGSLAIDGTIQRFEFVFELFWKTLKDVLELEGIQTNTPKETLQEAYRIKWLLNETIWLQMLKDRNQTSHIYSETTAKTIYEKIKEYFPEMKRVYNLLTAKLKETPGLS